ncbi:hypothetical protein Rhopal_006169-T1 [Rhodotorula paludigena]|uniref:Protein kinase domain-containing protein n=1 Tax=Rhodotorula paludigena TaxID=86838 RepID=A0AAV5GV73_9BASI|nr:hypothetical protein Rhopal_006169-T1 [Rhodotorula paludigena]
MLFTSSVWHSVESRYAALPPFVLVVRPKERAVQTAPDASPRFEAALQGIRTPAPADYDLGLQYGETRGVARVVSNEPLFRLFELAIDKIAADGSRDWLEPGTALTIDSSSSTPVLGASEQDLRGWFQHDLGPLVSILPQGLAGNAVHLVDDQHTAFTGKVDLVTAEFEAVDGHLGLARDTLDVMFQLELDELLSRNQLRSLFDASRGADGKGVDFVMAGTAGPPPPHLTSPLTPASSASPLAAKPSLPVLQPQLASDSSPATRTTGPSRHGGDGLDAPDAAQAPRPSKFGAGVCLLSGALSKMDFTSSAKKRQGQAESESHAADTSSAGDASALADSAQTPPPPGDLQTSTQPQVGVENRDSATSKKRQRQRVDCGLAPGGVFSCRYRDQLPDDDNKVDAILQQVAVALLEREVRLERAAADGVTVARIDGQPLVIATETSLLPTFYCDRELHLGEPRPLKEALALVSALHLWRTGRAARLGLDLPDDPAALLQLALERADKIGDAMGSRDSGSGHTRASTVSSASTTGTVKPPTTTTQKSRPPAAMAPLAAQFRLNLMLGSIAFTKTSTTFAPSSSSAATTTVMPDRRLQARDGCTVLLDSSLGVVFKIFDEDGEHYHDGRREESVNAKLVQTHPEGALSKIVPPYLGSWCSESNLLLAFKFDTGVPFKDWVDAAEYVISLRANQDGAEFRRFSSHYRHKGAILEAVSYFHSLGLTHGDLHPQNMLLQKDGTVHLIDLEQAVFREPEKSRLYRQEGEMEVLADKLERPGPADAGDAIPTLFPLFLDCLDRNQVLLA